MRVLTRSVAFSITIISQLVGSTLETPEAAEAAHMHGGHTCSLALSAMGPACSLACLAPLWI